ncbi:MAG TPA: condensation domain-containing protein, partial [Longimicrobiaceae bacterium]
PAIGRPFDNVRAYVLDEWLNPVPVGVPGELYAGGAGVARGYLNRPTLTAEKFIPDPFGAEPGARLYRTGDRVRWRADGVVEYLGRLDEQVKVRGFRIELGEIETVLRRHPGVADCAVIAREDTPGDRRIVAYVVGTAEPEELRPHIRRSLPEYMLPAAFVRLEQLPLSPNGKVDRKALPAPEFAGDERYVAPRTPAEELLAGIWAEVLRVERVGVHDSFFELGGHSLLATRVVSRVREVFAVELPLRALFEGPTVAELALAVESLRREGRPQPRPITPADRTQPPPLSFAQERLWFLDRMDPDSPLYNIPVALRLEGELDVPALERALGGIVARHESLRTTFAEVGGQPVQVIAPFEGFHLTIEDLSQLDEAAREAAVRNRATAAAARKLDISTGPLLRAALIRLGEQDHALLVTMHHIVSDGWSMGVFFRELSELYAAAVEGREPALPALPVQYADFAVWQREQLSGDGVERQLAWWREQLAGAPALLKLPTDRPRPAVQSYRGARVPVAFPPELLERLRKLERGAGATLHMVLMGAWQVLLARYAGADDVVVGTPIAGRTRAEVEGVIGLFVNTLVLRTDLSGDPTFREVLRRLRETALGAYEHQEVPFEKLVAELQPERSLSHSPLFQVMLTLQNLDRAAGGLPGIRMRGVGAELDTAKFDLSLVLGEDPRGLRGELTWATDLFDQSTVERMVEHFGRVLEQVAADADRRVSELELTGEAERRQVLEEWNRTSAPYPTQLVHELIAEQAARTPDAAAVVWERGSLTYAELEARANRLARHLRRLGVGTDSRVAVMLERGPE